MMYKDGNSISIDLLTELPTEESNGVEVFVNLKKGDLDKFTVAIKDQLVYFENLYVIDSTEQHTGIEKEFSEFVIKKYKNFNVNSLSALTAYSNFSGRIKVLLGKVQYPLRIDNLKKKYTSIISSYPIAVRFDIGDLEVTPNREEILYSEANILKIQENLDLVLEELEVLTDEHFKKEYKNVDDYLSAIRETNVLSLLVHGEKKVAIKTFFKNKNGVTLNGVSYDTKQFEAMYDAIIKSEYCKSSHRISNSRIDSYQYKSRISEVMSRSNTTICSVNSLNSHGKAYIRETYPNFQSFFPKVDASKLYKRTYKSVQDSAKTSAKYGNPTWHFDSKIFRVIFKAGVEKFNTLPKFDNSMIPKDFIEKRKKAAKDKRAGNLKSTDYWGQNVVLYQLRVKDTYQNKATSDAVHANLGDLNQKYKCLTVYGEKGSKRLHSLYLANPSARVKFVEIAKTKTKLLEQLSNFVHVDDYMDTKYKHLRNLGTAELIYRELPELSTVANISNLDRVSTELYNAIETLETFRKLNSRLRNTNSEIFNEVYELCKEENYFNEEIRAVLTKYKEDIEKSLLLIHFCTPVNNYSSEIWIPESRINIAVDYVLARKLFKPDIKAVKRLRDETVFNIKPEDKN